MMRLARRRRFPKKKLYHENIGYPTFPFEIALKNKLPINIFCKNNKSTLTEAPKTDAETDAKDGDDEEMAEVKLQKIKKKNKQENKKIQSIKKLKHKNKK